MMILNMSPRIKWSIILLLPILLILLLFGMFEEDMNRLIIELQDSLKNPWLISGIVIILLALDVILPIPSSILSAFAIASLGMELGAIAIWIGLTIGAGFGYFLGVRSRLLLKGSFLDEKSLKKAQKLGDSIGFGTLITLRAVPVLAEVSVIAAGLVAMPWWRFIAVVALANGGVALAYMYSVAQVGENGGFWLAFIAGIAVPSIAWGLYQLFLVIQKKEKVDNAIDVKSVDKEQLSVNFSISYNYPVLFSYSLFSKENSLLLDTLTNTSKIINSVLIYLDSGVANSNKDIQKNIKSYFKNQKPTLLTSPIVIEGGEKAKTPKQVEDIHKDMLKYGLDRHSCVIAIGGGAILDVVGYASATFHRGVEIIRIPTTVLAQNDAGVGVKNGFNNFGVKNLIGSFATPLAVLNDYNFLTTLPKREQIAGLAEAIKVALIRDDKFFDWIETNCDLLLNEDREANTYAIKECAKLHLKQITSGDPFEQGNSRPLDYGHWSAHWLESESNYELRHGEAVAIGMLLDSRYAVEIGLLSEKEFNRLLELLKKLGLLEKFNKINVYGFNLWHEALLKRDSNDKLVLLDGLEAFRQHLGGKLCLSMLSKIGMAIEIDQIDEKALERSLLWLQNLK